MTSNEDRLENTKHEIHNKLGKLERRLNNMKTLDEQQTSTITDLYNTSNSTETGKVLIEAKRAYISKTQEDLAQAEDNVNDLTLSCNNQQLSINDEKADILRMETQKPKDHEMLEQYRADVINIANANAVLETQIQDVNR